MQGKIKAVEAYGLEKGKFYIIKCLEDETTDSGATILTKSLIDAGIQCIVCMVMTKDSITIAKTIEPKKRG